MPHTKVIGLLAAEKIFDHIWEWPPSWSCGQDNLNKLSFIDPKESPLDI